MKGLVLSGGGSHAFAHLGVLKAFEEQSLSFDKISACSSGAIIGAFYANNVPVMKIYELIQRANIFKLLRVNWTRSGVLKLDEVQENIKELLGTDNFESLNKKLIINATDLESGEVRYFDSSISLTDAIIASCSIPILFAPKKIDDKYYIDGGYVNNLPAEALVESCDYILGINNYTFNPKKKKEWNYKSVIRRTMPILCNTNVKQSLKLCNAYIAIEELEEFNPLSTGSSKKIFEIGYKKGKEFLSKNNLDFLKNTN